MSVLLRRFGLMALLRRLIDICYDESWQPPAAEAPPTDGGTDEAAAG